ncbi:MAG TPA: DUF883 family protein [Candidatus Paceibacterota bacterium]|nr:DUF883 family protein [Verrucomicrobiota bacterium]HRY48150.1 DUF883 family protein [Candidatus Paceibacterota bacterium]HSA00362.1 DUF883 family protein [Candidatus Paceibacterota bacterium]
METHFDNMERAQNEVARERIMEDLKSLARDAEELLKVTAGDVSEKTKEARSKLASALERAKASCQQMEERALASAKDAARKADMAIRSHPYESIGLAFGLGLLIGVLVGRK